MKVFCYNSMIVLSLVLILQNIASGDNNGTSSITIPGGGAVCQNIEKALSKTGGGACRCFESVRESDGESENDNEEVASPPPSPHFPSETTGPWLACTRERMPVLYRSLNALPNGTIFDKLWIWDSLVPVVPLKFFGRIGVRKLILENDHVGEFADGVLTPLAAHLRHVIIKNNIVRELNERLFEGLREVRLLDLSINLITQLNRTSFGRSMKKLHWLSLYGNRLVTIGTGAFDSLTNLRKLNLASNALTRLDDGVFSNLHKLEYLTLENNRLTYLANGLFNDLHNLKVLNLGGNQLASLRLPGTLSHLTQLYLHNNSLFSMSEANVQLDMDQMTNLKTLHLDNNHLVSLENDQFSKMISLQVLSIASNELLSLQPNCFRNLHNLSVLSLQNNRLDDSSFRDASLFANVPTLKKLYLSQNQLTTITTGMLDKLTNLRVASLAHNRIHSIEIGTFRNVGSLERLYFNDNNLSNLHNSTLDELSTLTLSAVDFSDNPWNCDCDSSLSLAKWLHIHSDVVIDTEHTLCADNGQSLGNAAVVAVGQSCPEWHHNGNDSGSDGTFDQLLSNRVGNSDTGSPSSTSFWITALGVMLGVVSMLILFSIALLYVQDGRWAALKERRANLLKRVPSDMVNLIPKCAATSIEKV